MQKKLTIKIIGNLLFLNELISNYLKEIQNMNSLSLSIDVDVAVAVGLAKRKPKSAHNVLLLVDFDERKILKKIKELKSTYPDFKLILLTNFVEADFICALYNNDIHAHLSTLDNLLELKKALECVLINKIFHSSSTDKLISEYYSKAHLKSNSKLQKPLSKMEKVVLKQLCNSKTSPEIADILCKSVKTINSHRQHIYDKLGVHNISDLIMWANKNKFDFES